jgi:hypothetical protein
MSTEPSRLDDLWPQIRTTLWQILAYLVAADDTAAAKIITARLIQIDPDLGIARARPSSWAPGASLEQKYLFVRGTLALEWLDLRTAGLEFEAAAKLGGKLGEAANRQVANLQTFLTAFDDRRSRNETPVESLVSRLADLERAWSDEVERLTNAEQEWRRAQWRDEGLQRGFEEEERRQNERHRAEDSVREARLRQLEERHRLEQERWRDDDPFKAGLSDESMQRFEIARHRHDRLTAELERIRGKDSFSWLGDRPDTVEPASLIVKRTPHMDISVSQPIQRGTSFKVTIYGDMLELRPGEEAEEIAVVLPPTRRSVEVEVWLAGTSHFEIYSRTAQIITIEHGVDQTTVASFDVCAKEDATSDGPASLNGYFFYNGRPCGQVWRTIELVTEHNQNRPAGPSEESEPVAVSMIAPDVLSISPDITVEITNPSKDSRTFEVRVTTPWLTREETPEREEWKPRKPAELVADLMAEFSDENATAYARTLSLRGAGQGLFDAAPESFKRVLWELIDRGAPPTSIYIVTQEPYLPWELMIPNRSREDGSHQTREPLGVEFAVGRWITQSHLSPRQTLPLNDAWVIAPRYDGSPASLPCADTEAAYVCDTFAGTKVDPADVEQIDKTLQKQPRSLVHFICHGGKGAPGIQVIFVHGNQQRLTSTMARAMSGIRAQCRAGAVIFLNACEVGQPVPALVGLGGFARVFTEFGAGAVIAPLWAVDDTLAHDVATRFYSEVVANRGRPFAEILRDIRSRAYNPLTGLDTYAAYCFYGDPRAKAL